MLRRVRMWLSKLLECWEGLEPDAQEVVVEVAARLVKGRAAYGDLDIEKDKRDFIQESAEELFDNSVYLASEVIKLRRLRRKYEAMVPREELGPEVWGQTGGLSSDSRLLRLVQVPLRT